MDAIERRRKIFRDELIRDIPVLSDLIRGSKHAAIRDLAHKYKMRLTYFEEWEALESCREIVRCHNEGEQEGIIENATVLSGILTAILNQLDNESTDS